MAMKAKHAFGSEAKISEALAAGKIDAYDILFLDEKKVGWVNKSGEVVIAEPDLSGVEAEIATKANAAEVEAGLASKANVDDVSALESEIATKANVEEVEAKIGQAVTDTVATAKAYTDGKIEAAISEHLVKKYEITHKPDGTLVNYRDKEIRVMCPADTKWVKQNVGANGNANMYYMGFKAYAPNNAVSFKEDDQATIVDQTMYYFENNDFAGIDENGRKYSIVWLALASYDETTDTWSYFGAKSSAEKYIGWYYSVEWYNADGVMIASDCIRINLSNEQCHSSIEPYYVSGMMSEVDAKINTKIEEKLLEVEASYEVIEF